MMVQPSQSGTNLNFLKRPALAPVRCQQIFITRLQFYLDDGNGKMTRRSVVKNPAPPMLKVGIQVGIHSF